MAAGVVWYFERADEPPLWAGGLAAVVALAMLAVTGRWMVPRALCHLAVAVSLGFAAAQAASWRAAPVIEIPSKATVVSGIVRAVDLLPTGRRVLLTAPRFDGGPAQPRSVRIRLRATDTTEIATGDTLAVRALLSRPASPALPGGWDLQRDAFFAGIGGFGYALNPASVAIHAGPGSLAAWAQALRETIAARVMATLPDTPGAIATTLLTGSTSRIPDADRAAFRDSGLAHLLAIAGLHIGIVMGLIFGGTRLALASFERTALFLPCKAIAAVTALVAGGLYLGLTGAHVPIIRSFAMACLVTLGVLAGRRALSLRGLGLAMAAVVLIAAPEVVGVSFQMSFSAVLALIVGYDLLRPWLSRLHGDGSAFRRFAGHVTALALTSALAGTFSAPFAAYHFGHVQIYYVLANMAAVPITAMLVMPAGLLALVLMPLHLEALALAPMGWGIAAILWIARSVAALPQATIAVPHIPAWGLAVFSLGLAWAGIWRTRLRLAGVPLMLLGLLSPLSDTPPDLLISADARLIALHRDGLMLVQKTSDAAAFTLDAWQQYWAAGRPLALDCPAPNCLLHQAPDVILVRADADQTLCGARLLVAAEPIRLRCAEPVAWVDRFTVWRNGAHAVWFTPSGPIVVSDRSSRGERPWVLGLPLAGRVPAGTVPALIDPLPDP
jgi:competence protein ComEC